MRNRVSFFYCLACILLALGLGGCVLFTSLIGSKPAPSPASPTVPEAPPVPTVPLSPPAATHTTAAPTQPPAASTPVPYVTAPVADLSTAFPTPQPTILATPGAFPPVTSYQFIDAQSALAVIAPDYDINFKPLPGTFRLLRSTDGARTWRDIAPGEVLDGSLTGVLDASFFWVNSAPADPTTGHDTLYRTTDGGQSWKKISVPFAMAGIHMIDTRHGWAIASPDGCGAGTCWVQLFSTIDGGLTWTAYRPQPPLHTEPVMSDITISMSSGSDIQFSARDTIWFGGGSIDYGMPDLLVSRDRGQTWQTVEITLPEGLNLQNLRLPVFLDENNGFLTLTVSPGEDPLPSSDQRMTAVFATTDGGRTWTLRPLAAFGDWNNTIQFVTSTDWFTSCQAQLCRTTDGGQTWQALPLPAVRGAASFTVDRFVDARTGYAIASFAPHGMGAYREYKQIYATYDGGQHWTALEAEMR